MAATSRYCWGLKASVVASQHKHQGLLSTHCPPRRGWPRGCGPVSPTERARVPWEPRRKEGSPEAGGRGAGWGGPGHCGRILLTPARPHPPEGSAGSPLGHAQSPRSREAGSLWNPCKRANLPGLDFPLNAPLFFSSESKAVRGRALLPARSVRASSPRLPRGSRRRLLGPPLYTEGSQRPERSRHLAKATQLGREGLIPLLDCRGAWAVRSPSSHPGWAPL